jgi:hypothetical protein
MPSQHFSSFFEMNRYKSQDTSNLFNLSPFLEKKLGSKIFENIPQSAGIYRFYDDFGKLLYVGKAKNLRKRLYSYKRIRPGNASRKVSSLLSKITAIEFDKTASEKEAFLSENRWIREHRPEFNHANKATETYYFILIGRSENNLHFRLTMNPDAKIMQTDKQSLFKSADATDTGVATNFYGCFKGHYPVRRSLGALLQLLWLAENKSVNPLQLPVVLSRNLTPLYYSLRLNNKSILVQSGVYQLVDDWFSGKSDRLCHFLFDLLEPEASKNRFAAQFLEERIETLQTHFIKTLHRHFLIRKKFLEPKRHIIFQQELDDLMVRHIHQPEV